MMQSHSFLVPFQGETLYAESTFGRNGHVLMLHGGGKDRTIFHKYRVMLDESGFGTTIFDFLGHGETGGDIRDSSLLSRTQQATAVMDFQGRFLPVVWASAWGRTMRFNSVKWFRCAR